jgi:hypothetical protein
MAQIKQLIFNEVRLEDVVKDTRYLVAIRGESLTFGTFDENGIFHNEGYGYHDAQSWQPDEIIAVYTNMEQA